MKSMITYRTFTCEDCKISYQGIYPYTYEGKVVCDYCQALNYEA